MSQVCSTIFLAVNLLLAIGIANTQPTGEVSSSSQSSSNFKQPLGMNNPFESMMQGPMSATSGLAPPQMPKPSSSSVSQSSFANGIQGNGQPNGHLMSGMQYGPIEQLISTFGSTPSSSPSIASPPASPASSASNSLSSTSNASGVSGKTIDEHDADGNIRRRRRRRQTSALESFFTSDSNPISDSSSNFDSGSSMDRVHKPAKGKCA